MTYKTIGVLGILTTIFFAAGFIGLFIINRQAYEEFNNFNICGFNLDGMPGENWIKTSYIIVGLLNTIILIGLFRLSDNKSIIVVGKILLLISGVTWTTLGLINYDLNSDFGNHLLAQRTIAILTAGIFGLIIIGAEIEKITSDNFLKYFTLLTGGTILTISILSIFVFWDESWVRTNISVIIYFMWFTVFGLRIMKKASA